MKFYLIYMKRTHPGQPEPELVIKEFEGANAKLEMLHYAAENHVTQRGVRYYAAIEEGELILGGPTGMGVGDIYDEINKLERTRVEVGNVKA